MESLTQTLQSSNTSCNLNMDYFCSHHMHSNNLSSVRHITYYNQHFNMDSLLSSYSQ
ncbi:hypothetical protein LDENG_00215630, partial [Lucifuga dentata]